eukprot:scaffold8700_cov62-Phaeocystis_antarctica.AAC.1
MGPGHGPGNHQRSDAADPPGRTARPLCHREGGVPHAVVPAKDLTILYTAGALSVPAGAGRRLRPRLGGPQPRPALSRHHTPKRWRGAVEGAQRGRLLAPLR